MRKPVVFTKSSQTRPFKREVTDCYPTSPLGATKRNQLSAWTHYDNYNTLETGFDDSIIQDNSHIIREDGRLWYGQKSRDLVQKLLWRASEAEITTILRHPCKLLQNEPTKKNKMGAGTHIGLKVKILRPVRPAHICETWMGKAQTVYSIVQNEGSIGLSIITVGSHKSL